MPDLDVARNPIQSTCLIGIYLVLLTVLTCQNAGSEAISRQNADRQVSYLVQDGGFGRCWREFRNHALYAPERLPEIMAFP
jgi:hypothetical protein